ncbi:MAG: hypothetical protein IOC92_04910 [Rhodobacter sp.]|nr:hypothetical protein [Rhodobacter sp.]MCA3456032.1 hypothetical protein [Rhodobacter sp.]MCA3460512.1 hypothetical protein [Rhodobacter sp.]MCA3463908.1 hypothetical protein [Rhodobacter sp.]MCA3468278.1 hypothetical protein [Rhodobacter sp.]
MWHRDRAERRLAGLVVLTRIAMVAARIVTAKGCRNPILPARLPAGLQTV